MSASDKTEKVLRNLHVLLSKSEPYPKEPSKVIVDKQQMLDLLNELNKSIYDIMDEYELTKQSRDRAEREFHKKGDEIIWDASRKAEDIYAASVMYTDEALNSVQDIMKEATATIASICMKMDTQLKDQQKVVKKNQLELKSSLQDLVDTEKYLKLIEERNHELQKQKESKTGKKKAPEEANLYANRQTEVKVNAQVLKQLGLAAEEPVAEETKMDEQLAEAKLNADLDDLHFENLNEDEKSEKEKSEKESKDAKDSIQKVWKNLTQGKK